jgi:hypothetical protein
VCGFHWWPACVYYVVVQVVLVLIIVDFCILDLEFLPVVILDCYDHVDELCTVTSFSTVPLNPNSCLNIRTIGRLKFHHPLRRYQLVTPDDGSRTTFRKFWGFNKNSTRCLKSKIIVLLTLTIVRKLYAGVN